MAGLIQNLIRKIYDSEEEFKNLVKERKLKPGQLFITKDEFFSLNSDMNLEDTILENEVCLLCDILHEPHTIFEKEEEITRLKFWSNHKFFYVSTITLAIHSQYQANISEVFDSYFVSLTI